MKKIFLSYSWENEEHKKLVKEISELLESDGLNVTLDQWDLKPGDELALYMEKAITESDYVLIVCSEGYKEKADNRLGGSGYEAKLITSNLSMDQHIKKFIPVFIGGNWSEVAPEFIKGNMYVDLSSPLDSNEFQTNYTDLLTTIHNIVRKKPNNVDAMDRISKRLGLSKDEIEYKEDTSEIKIIGIITEEVTVPKNDGTSGSALYSIPFKLSNRPGSKWSDFFIKSWNNPPKYTLMHRPRIAKVINDKIILNGTTIEEVKNYHRDTLMLAVEVANNKVRQDTLRQQNLESKQRYKEKTHYDNLDNHINDIKF